MTYDLSHQQHGNSPILLIRQLREGKVPGTVSVRYVQGDKELGLYTISYVHMSTLQLRPVPDSHSLTPIYVPNPLHCSASFEVSADCRTFVTIKEDQEIIFALTFNNFVFPLED